MEGEHAGFCIAVGPERVTNHNAHHLHAFAEAS